MDKIICKIDMNNRLVCKKINSVNLIGNLCFFVICPFASFLKSIFNLNKIESLIIVFLSNVLFGWSITILDNDIGMDFYVTTQRFLHGKYLSFEDFILVIKNTLLGVGEDKDVYQNILIYIVRLFSMNYHLFWSISAIVFSFFILNHYNLLYMIQNIKHHIIIY